MEFYGPPQPNAMKLAYFDPFSGISGDMTVGALLDAGADAAALVAGLDSLQTGATFAIEKTRRRGIAATKFRVIGGETSSHRHLPEIARMIEAASLPEKVKEDAIRVFETLGAAEAGVHGVPLMMVHFHEVGAADSICDIVGACLALHLLGVGQVACARINTGSGTVNTEHGVLPIPAPATASLLMGKPIYARGPAMELTTPTGAALVTALGEHFGSMPPMSIAAAGYGAGDKDFAEHANVLRVLIGETSGAVESTTVTVLEANIDDASPQVLGYALEKLLDAGALDATLTPLLMKKSRPGHLLRVIGTPDSQEMLAGILFAETPTLGLRLYTAERRVLGRQLVEVQTADGVVRLKTTENGSYAPEYEDCRRIAQKTGRPLRQILAEATLAYAKEAR